MSPTRTAPTLQAEAPAERLKTGGSKTLKRHSHRSQTLCKFGQVLALVALLALAARARASTTKYGPDRPTSPPTATPQPSTATLRLEEEVEILARPAGRRLPKPAGNSSRAHVYRLRSPPLNGRLSPPQRGDQSAALVAPAGREEPPFGARSPRPTQPPAPTKPPGEACRESEGEQVSIAASSPTLRLTALERRPPLFVGPQPLPATELEEAVAESRESGKQAVALQSAGRPAAQSSLVQARGPAADVLRRLGNNVLGPLRLSELSLLDGAAGEGEQAGETILSLIDEYDSKIITNRTKAQLSCDSGEMILRLNFSEPFKGIVYPDHNRLSACRFFGDGHLNYELRLPLRGCGTRQAAPRVFVNDVIVRFHKALELEEDEVKTLICRYPPPLAPAAQTISSTGNSLRTSTELSAELDQAQFELVDPQSGRPSPPEAGSSGNIETLSENLVVAPTGGLAANPLEALPNNPYAGPSRVQPNRQRPAGELPAGDLFRQRNSLSAEPGNSAGGYLERLSSVELLFLISSLLFLILLALGLAGSLYCFRQRAGGQQNRASAILRRKRRYVGGVFDQVATVPPSATLQQHYQQQLAGYLPVTAPSSPESDLSGRAGLLAGQSGSLAAGRYMLNRGYVHNEDLAHQHRSYADVYGAFGRERQQSAGRVPHAERRAPSSRQAGRRENQYGYGHTPGRTMRHVSPHRAHRLHLHQAAASIRPELSKSHEPLLTVGDHLRTGEHTLRPLRPRDRYGRLVAHQRAATMHRAQQVYVDNGHYSASPLWRAKSLSSFPQPSDSLQRLKLHNRHLKGATIVGNYRRRLQAEKGQQPAKRLSPSTEGHSSGSDSELSCEKQQTRTDEQNNNLLELLSREKPKIILKSIEDSYITNFTEIHEQEYLKRDSTRPLDLATWRAMQPKSSPAADSSDDGDPVDGYASAHTNLRSLTELDVNFVKTLPRPGAGGLSESAMRTAVSADRLPDGQAASGQTRSSSVPDVNTCEEVREAAKPLEARQQSPDLILSPEYDCSRLELEVPASSHNSISYV